MKTTSEDYIKLFENILELIHKAHLSSLFSYEVFDSFPNNISDSLKSDFNNEISYSLKERQLFIEGKNKEEIKAILGERTKSIINGSSFSYPFYKIQKIAHKNSNTPKVIAGIGNNNLLISEIDFHSIISEKQLVYIVGVIEGFILDSVRVIYYTNEEYIEQHNVKPDFSTLKNLENFEKLKTERIIHITHRKWGKGSFSTRMKRIKSKFRLDFDFDKRLVEILDEANLLRNCILHNGAKVSIEYFDFIKGKKETNIGDDIMIDRYFTECLYYLSLDFVTKLFYLVEPITFKTGIGELVYDHSYFKDVMLKEDNWIYKRLTENKIY
ncbi:hypothetical protein [Aquimarina rubra]|uniref:Apea-like HEPN domain-containing protein n=1 Tax=Aquimarina rubra TaxID=1920033 RepID=A0ABW5LJN0_9FLAO